MCPGTYRDAYQPISIKSDKLSDAEEVEEPVPITCPGIKAEPEVKYVHC
jgi:hypothetical protein